MISIIYTSPQHFLFAFLARLQNSIDTVLRSLLFAIKPSRFSSLLSKSFKFFFIMSVTSFSSVCNLRILSSNQIVIYNIITCVGVLPLFDNSVNISEFDICIFSNSQKVDFASINVFVEILNYFVYQIYCHSSWIFLIANYCN